MRFALLVCLCFGWLGACAHDIRALYPSEPTEPTGRLVLVLTDAADVTVAINGLLVVADEHTQRITIDHVPTGTNELTIAAHGGDKQLRVWVTSEHTTTVPVGVPEAGSSFLKTLAGSLITIVAYTLLR